MNDSEILKLIKEKQSAELHELKILEFVSKNNIDIKAAEDCKGFAKDIIKNTHKEMYNNNIELITQLIDSNILVKFYGIRGHICLLLSVKGMHRLEKLQEEFQEKL